MLKDHWLGLRRTLVAIDSLGGLLALLAVAWLAGAPAPHLERVSSVLPWLVLAAGALTIWPLSLAALGLYESQRRSSLPGFFARQAFAIAVTGLAMQALSAVLDGPLAPHVALLVGLVQGASCALLRGAVYGSLRFMRRLGRNFRHTLIVGTGPRAAHVRRVIERNPGWGYRVVGHVDDVEIPVAPAIPGEQVYKLMDVPSLLRDRVVDEVIVALPRSMLGTLGPLVSACAAAGIPVTLLTDLFGDFLPPPRVTRFDTLNALTFAPIHHSPVKLAVKRAVDVVGAAAILAVSAPVLAAAAAAIRLTSPGPVFFRQERCGVNGRRFEILKLRTMVPDAEQRLIDLLPLNEMDGPVFKLKADPRITPVGRFLRRYSLDELPQLWNVLRGDMSLVGPRPPLPHEVSQYETAERRRLSMRPGLTCLWQVSGRNEIGFDDWVRLDLEYIDGWCLALDLKILVRTLPAVVSGSGT
jgi:exopolysaccharide biosynthesis polyprenyl glycosylphosphotransferase